ncbi:MAG: MoxR family ATPase [Acidobacteria bacterium]|nr:MoxR family ATPase [Acidobacteriota bacterium]MCH8266807.1 MoxR family ATPase [Acidobacteriota bacterium]
MQRVSTSAQSGPQPAPDSFAELQSCLRRLEQNLLQVIRGKAEEVRLVLVALLSEGHLLIEDVPGVGKTTLARALARSLNCKFQRVQFTSDLLPSDVIGISVYNQHREDFEFKPGPVFANVLLADEINRTTPKTQSALLEAMNERQVTIDNRTHRLPEPFMVIATQNPIEHHGTYPLPESQMDRFLMRIRMGYPGKDGEREIVRATSNRDGLEALEPAASAQQIHRLQDMVRAVTVEDPLVNYMLAIVGKTREHENLALGVSPRGSQALYRAAQALAFLEGRNYCIPDDFKRLAIPVFAHRVVVSTRYASTLKKSEQAEAVVKEILESTEVPL